MEKIGQCLYDKYIYPKLITGALNFPLVINICCAIDTIKYICHKNCHIKIACVDEALVSSSYHAIYRIV